MGIIKKQINFFSPKIFTFTSDFTYTHDFTYTPDLTYTPDGPKKYALIGQFNKDLEFIIKLREGQCKNLGWFVGQFFVINAKVAVSETSETIFWIIDSRSNSNLAFLSVAFFESFIQ